MTAEEAKALKVAIRQLVRAEVAGSWKGSAYPEDVPLIEAELRAARIRVSVLIARATRDK